MKSVTEFPTHKLVQGLSAKTALLAEGKTPEEILAKLGETFKMEGDKLKHFFNALDVAGQNMEKLSRVLVLSIAAGESIPQKAVKVEEHHYLPEFQIEFKPKTEEKSEKGGKGGRKGRPDGKKGGGPKESPWGLSPEQKAAKKAGGKNKAAAAAAATAGGGGAAKAPAGGGAPASDKA